METTIKLKTQKTTTYYSSTDTKERLIRFFNALYNARTEDECQQLVAAMGFVKGRSKNAKEIWSYETGSNLVKVGSNNYNPITGNFAHGKSLDKITLVRIPSNSNN